MILTYHELVSQVSGYRYGLTAERFGTHLRWLNENRPGECAKDPWQITFDDGHSSNYRYGVPLLAKFGRRAVFFITAAGVGARPDVMSWAQLREMHAAGHAIESHGWSHKFLPHCADDELREELERSKRTLEDGLGAPVTQISMPGGRCDARVLRACAAAGYTTVFDSHPWREPKWNCGVEFAGRLMVHRELDIDGLHRLLNMRGRVRLALRARYGAKEMVRKTLGDHLYHRLWCAISAESERRQIDREYA